MSGVRPVGSWVDAYMGAWNNHDGSAVAAFMAEDVMYEDVGGGGMMYEGLEAIKGFADMVDRFSKDYTFTPVGVQQSNDQYAIEWEWSGTNTGDGGRLPATNKPFRIRGVSIGRIDAQGKIKQNRDYWNTADLLTQLGHPPAPSG